MVEAEPIPHILHKPASAGLFFYLEKNGSWVVGIFVYLGKLLK